MSVPYDTSLSTLTPGRIPWSSACWKAKTPSPSPYCASDPAPTFTVAPVSLTHCQLPDLIRPALTMIERVVGTDQLLSEERVEVGACGTRLGRDPDPEPPGQRPALTVHPREHPQGDELVGGREEALLEPLEILGPLPVPLPCRRGARGMHAANPRIDQRLDRRVGMR